ncbi:MAG TPA: hypothetical protein VNN80_35860 [Polyangiaceae bacterium]|nr:hypothetical protein [Polyangiaceae bacterium]
MTTRRVSSTMTVYALLVVDSISALGCNRPDVPKARRELAPLGAYPVDIHQPARFGRVRIGVPAPNTSSASAGSEKGVAVRCATCHELRPAAPLPASMLELDQFHQGLELRHGVLGCASCHTPGASTTLHLADGRRLQSGQAIELCRQCHGPQYRDYEHGAHGGMTGYWDLSRGPRTRNHCVDCHDPHAPQIRQVIPAAPPRDRFMGERASASAAAHEGGEH